MSAKAESHIFSRKKDFYICKFWESLFVDAVYNISKYQLWSCIFYAKNRFYWPGMAYIVLPPSEIFLLHIGRLTDIMTFSPFIQLLKWLIVSCMHTLDYRIRYIYIKQNWMQSGYDIQKQKNETKLHRLWKKMLQREIKSVKFVQTHDGRSFLFDNLKSFIHCFCRELLTDF